METNLNNQLILNNEIKDISKNELIDPSNKKELNLELNRKKMKSFKRQTSMKTYFRNHKEKSPIIISSYDIERQKFVISEEDLEGKEFKQYFIDTIKNLNNNKLFDLKNTNLPIIYPAIFHSIIAVIFMLFLYLFVLLFVICCLNPMILVIFIFILKYIYSTLYLIKYLISSKIKRSLMNKVISKENEVCLKNYDIQWILGKECLWIELHQNNIEKSHTINSIVKEKETYNQFIEEV